MNTQENITTDLTVKDRVKAIVGGSIGNLVEWYDWYAYAAFAIKVALKITGKNLKSFSLLKLNHKKVY